MSEIPQEELDYEVPITRDEPKRLNKISGQLYAGIDDWLNPPSGIAPKTIPEICANLIAQVPKLVSPLKISSDEIQIVAAGAALDNEPSRHTERTADGKMS